MAPSQRVLVVGAGSIGERHIRCLESTGRTQVSFVEINQAQRAAMAERHPLATAFGSLEQAIDHPPDVAVVATPAPLHIEQATRLVDRGVHVLIEKPLSVNLTGIDSLAERVRQKNVIAGVAYVMRAQPALAGMQRAIASGRFGKPLQLVVVSGQSFPFYRPAYRNTYYARHESGGGAVQDALTHMLNAGQWLVGPIDRLVADAAHLALPGVDVEDTAHVLARQGSVLASYSLNQHQAPNETSFTVVCERGTARLEVHEGRWRSNIKPGEPWTDHGVAPLDRDGPFVRQAHAFLDAVEGKGQPLCSLAEGIATLRANIAVLESVASGRWVSTC